MKFKIELTWSKIMALIIILYAYDMDRGVEGSPALFYVVPFILIMIGGKQVLDRNKKEG